jgi:hypothetical protein
LLSAPPGVFEKSGKTATTAMATLYVLICLGGRYAEGYGVADDFDQLRAESSELSCRLSCECGGDPDRNARL